jgi:hypothetical protein
MIHIAYSLPNTACLPLQRIVVVLRADSPEKAAQWFAESIPES